jgi:hypothetical protein
MRLIFASIVIASFCEMARSQPADILPEALQAAYQQFRYYWLAAPAGKTAELLTLFCRVCSLEASGSQDLPLVSVLRDTLGDSDPKNDRVFYVWFLTSSRPSFGQRLLSAVPFSCWRVGAGSQNVNVTPRIDLSAPAPDCTRIVFWLSLRSSITRNTWEGLGVVVPSIPAIGGAASSTAIAFK